MFRERNAILGLSSIYIKRYDEDVKMRVAENKPFEYGQENCSDFGLHPFAGTFRKHELERDFQQYQLKQTQAQLRITLSFCACFYVAFAVSDVAALGYTESTLTLFMARLLVMVAAAGGIYLVSRYPESIAVPRFAATVVEIVGMSAFLLVVLYRPGEMAWHAMSMSIMLVVVYLFIPNAFLNAMTVAVCTSLAFGLVALKIGTLSLSDAVTMSMLLVLCNAFGIVAALRYGRLWRQEFRAQTILRDLSFLDHLTGCYNRRYMETYLLEQEIERACRYPAWLTVILCDLDHFKAVNDTYGHPTGDAVLQYFAALLQSTCRDHVDSVIRYGGEEFMLILPETDLQGGVLLAERLRRAIADHPAYSDSSLAVTITASFGVVSLDCSVPGRGVTPQLLISRADELLYRAKKAGRNRVEAAELSREPAVQ